MLKASIGVLVSGGGTNLQALLDAERDGVIKSGCIALVVSSRPDAYALTRARERSVPTQVADRAAYASRHEFEAELLRMLGAYGIDVIVLAGFMHILSAEFVAHYPERMLNVHPSLIPAFCGAGYYGLKVHEAALRRGVCVTGATVHIVNEVPDGGRILLQKAVDVLPGDTPELIQRRVMEQAEWQLLPRATELVCSAYLDERRRNVDAAT